MTSHTTNPRPGYYWVMDQRHPAMRTISEWLPCCGPNGMWFAPGVNGGFGPEWITILSPRIEIPDGCKEPTGWHAIDAEPIPNTVFDVVAKYYEATLDRFLMRRFTNCVQVDGVVLWGNPFDTLSTPGGSKPIRLTDHGFRPIYWMHVPEGPVI